MSVKTIFEVEEYGSSYYFCKFKVEIYSGIFRYFNFSIGFSSKFHSGCGDANSYYTRSN